MPNPQDFGAVAIGPDPSQFGGVPIPKEEPSLAGGNAALARTVGNAMKPAFDTLTDVGSLYAPVETALNAATGLLFGFPAYVGAGLSGVAQKYLFGQDVDPKQLAETISKVFTYLPQTERGKRLTGNVMLPLEKLAEVGQEAGHAVIDLPTASARGVKRAAGTPEAAVGAITDATIQMLPAVLLGALGRRMSGNIPASEDFANTAKTVVPDGSPPEHVAAAESNLRETYEKTGIDPFTVAEAAKVDPTVAADLVRPDAGIPAAMAEFYHGSPHDFTEFDASKIGTGEGFQAYGHGLYFAENPEVAGAYKSSLEGANYAYIKGEPIKGDAPLSWAIQAIHSGEAPNTFLQKMANNNPGLKPELTEAIERLPEAEKLQDTSYGPKPGAMYKVQIPQHVVDSMLDWDKPVGEQPAIVQKALNSPQILARLNQARDRAGMPPWDEVPNVSVENLLKQMGAIEGDSHARQLLSDDLMAQGVTGIRYLDQGSRAAGEGTRNIVLFDPKHATILEKNGKPVSPEVRQEVLDRANSEPPPTDQPALDVSGPTNEEITQMNAGLNPAATVRAIGESYTPFVGVEQVQRPRSPIGDALQKVFAPASRGPIAETEAGIIRANLGAMAHEREVAMTKLHDYAKQFDKDTPENNYKFIDAMEKGTALDDPKMAESAQALRDLLDAKRDEVQALGKGQLENFDENYFPHIWKDPEAVSNFFSRRPLTGSGSFLKQRSFETFKEGLDAGFKPITDNPVELALLKAREIDRYVYGQKIFEEMKDAGLAKFVRFGDDAPQGWTKINDKVARVFQHSEPEAGMILRGEYYAPDEAATLINNHLSPGLQGNGIYDALRGVGMAMNSVQLGLSLFHVGFTTLDAMTSRVALGVKQISRGDVLEGAGNVAVGLSPAQPFLNIYKGDRLLRAYMGNLDSPEMAPVVQAIMDAGGRVKMDDFYRNTTVNAFKQAIRSGDKVGMAKQLIPTILDRMSAPIFEWLVPRQKLGVYFDMAQDFLKNNPDADVATKRAELGKLWDSVDNRMGQLVYDNVFWNHVLKDALMASVRSVGWNLGTFRELGGGVYDIKDILKNKGLTDRTAYVIALPLLAGIYGAITQYAYTGEAPRDMKDLFFPRTGRIRPDGTEDRVSLPTYMKDVYAYAKDLTDFGKYGSNPTQTIQNKMHPLIATISQMLNNQDFFGAAIRNPADTLVKQAMDEAQYVVDQFEPFSLRNYKQQAKLREQEPSVKDYLTSPSMVGITPAPGYITKSPEEQESAEISRLRDPIMKKYRQLIKDNPDKTNAYIGEMQKAGLSKNDIRFVLRSSSNTPRKGRLKTFGTEPEEATQ